MFGLDNASLWTQWHCGQHTVHDPSQNSVLLEIFLGLQSNAKQAESKMGECELNPGEPYPERALPAGGGTLGVVAETFVSLRAPLRGPVSGRAWQYLAQTSDHFLVKIQLCHTGLELKTKYQVSNLTNGWTNLAENFRSRLSAFKFVVY